MRKIIVLSMLLLAASFSSVAQTTPAPARAAAVQYEHCMLAVTGQDYDQARLEFGQHFKGGSTDVAMLQADQMVRKLRSAAAALNYLSSLGWECVGINSIPYNNQTGYLLRRAK
ncbi:hypothetical protein ACFST9_09515 [Hymenobacter monticola]|uniref:Uncharacterized protein n=1 Tax=Hymenobacter monticola TaxID=1705399 RepID=A0ABY4B8U0_9BACT|nr:hypothetical protein [Hymenobacter monticola]UOE35562.1 hypothetical protein MTP16_07890 [Hymenobacter monticola]